MVTYVMNVAYGHKDTERFIRDIASMGDKYSSVGLRILLFPSDQFGDQATDKQYKSLLHKRQKGVTMMGKVRRK
jgi:glutathione peroxidase-family protein